MTSGHKLLRLSHKRLNQSDAQEQNTFKFLILQANNGASRQIGRGNRQSTLTTVNIGHFESLLACHSQMAVQQVLVTSVKSLKCPCACAFH